MTPMAIASGTSGPERFDLGGKIEIAIGQTVGRMGCERDTHPAPADVDIGMMIGTFREEADTHDERDRVGKRLTLEGLDDFVACALPSVERLERGHDLG